jgi:serine/threonine protein kinase
MGKMSHHQLKELIAQCIGSERVPKRINVVTDTSDFFRVEYDDVVILQQRPYLIRNYKREGRFGICDQPKFWVKSAIDLISGESKIIKMVFHEKFKARIGDLVFDCVRSPKKEARILDLVKGHRSFMQGISTLDSAGNIIRILDYIQGNAIEDEVLNLGESHEDYFYNHFPAILSEYIELVKAIKFLHDHGEKHGDIRRDHILRDKSEDHYRWIDFDFNYWHEENMFGYDLFGLGNILIYLTGRGDITTQDIKQNSPDAFRCLSPEDLNIIFSNRIVNLRKIYPHIPETLNVILLQFSSGASLFYDETSQLLSDLEEARDKIWTLIPHYS